MSIPASSPPRVQSGEVRFFLLGGGFPGGGPGGGTGALSAWVQASCVPASGSEATADRGALYDCGGLQGTA